MQRSFSEKQKWRYTGAVITDSGNAQMGSPLRPIGHPYLDAILKCLTRQLTDFGKGAWFENWVAFHLITRRFVECNGFIHQSLMDHINPQEPNTQEIANILSAQNSHVPRGTDTYHGITFNWWMWIHDFGDMHKWNQAVFILQQNNGWISQNLDAANKN